MWRERLRNALTEVHEGRTHTQPPENIDELNDAELPEGIGTPLADAAARSDHLLLQLIDLYGKLGDRPFKWYAAPNTSEAILRNSYTHPRLHLGEYWKENARPALAAKLWAEAEPDLQAADVAPRFVAVARYNLACAKVPEGALDEAIKLLEQALSVSDDLKAAAPDDKDLAPLREDPRFQALITP